MYTSIYPDSRLLIGFWLSKFGISLGLETDRTKRKTTYTRPPTARMSVKKGCSNVKVAYHEHLPRILSSRVGKAHFIVFCLVKVLHAVRIKVDLKTISMGPKIS